MSDINEEVLEDTPEVEGEEETNETNEVNPLEMSDEDILNMPEPAEEGVTVDESDEAESAEATNEDESQDSTISDTAEDIPAEEKTDETGNAPEKTADSDGGSQGAADEGDSGDEQINYEEELKSLLTPFKANGKQIKVSSVQDIRKLMQMGANYNKKMAGLKPNLKIMKMLSNNDLLNEEKLTYLIDLQKKNPEAIAKFIKESGIDPLDIDTEKDTEYKPGTYTVDDKEVELDMVLEEIQETPSFNETVDIISNKWDDSSKRVVLAEPALIKVINEHVESGVYAQIMEIVSSEKTLGRLTELSDLEAYKHVGDVLQEQGAFDSLDQGEKTDSSDTQSKPASVPSTTNTKSEDPKLNQRRRAASSPKGAGKKTQTPQFDPLAMSDEDFEKAAASMGI